MTESSAHDSRLVQLEMQLMHLERNYEQLHAVCLGQHEQIESQHRRIVHLENLLRRLLDAEESEREEHVDPFAGPSH